MAKYITCDFINFTIPIMSHTKELIRLKTSKQRFGYMENAIIVNSIEKSRPLSTSIIYRVWISRILIVLCMNLHGTAIAKQ